MADTRRQNVNWSVADSQGNVHPRVNEGAVLAVLMDIRAELQRLNSLLHCPNFQGIPRTLEAIRQNTTKPRRRRRG